MNIISPSKSGSTVEATLGLVANPNEPSGAESGTSSDLFTTLMASALNPSAPKLGMRRSSISESESSSGAAVAAKANSNDSVTLVRSRKLSQDEPEDTGLTQPQHPTMPPVPARQPRLTSRINLESIQEGPETTPVVADVIPGDSPLVLDPLAGTAAWLDASLRLVQNHVEAAQRIPEEGPTERVKTSGWNPTGLPVPPLDPTPSENEGNEPMAQPLICESGAAESTSEVPCPVKLAGSETPTGRKVAPELTAAVQSPVAEHLLEKDLGGSPQFSRSAVGAEAMPHGTSAAQLHNQMKFAPNRSDIAGRAEQELPGVRGAAEVIVATEPGRTEPRKTPVLRDSDVAFWSLPVSEIEWIARTASVDRVESAIFRWPGHERLLHQIEAEVKLISSTRAERLTILLKPDSNTEILLQLRVQDGCIQAHARCNRGNFDALNADWGQLQHSLSASGVKLASLTAPLGTGYEWQNTHSGRLDSNSSFQERRPHQDSAEEADADLALINRLPQSQRRSRQLAARLLESWA